MLRNAGEMSFLDECPTLIPGCMLACSIGPASTGVPEPDDRAASPEPPVAARTIEARNSGISAPPIAPTIVLLVLRARITASPFRGSGPGLSPCAHPILEGADSGRQ